MTRLQTSLYHRGVQPVVLSAQMREIDRMTIERCGITSLTLMENAAAATTRAVGEHLPGGVASKSILVFCGRGNNGGDGAATGRLLALAGAKVDIVLFGAIEDTKTDARENFESLKRLLSDKSVRLFECGSADEWRNLRADKLAGNYALVVDALLGTGPTRPLEGVQLEAVRYLRQLNKSIDKRDSNPNHTGIISIDIPSGLSSDSSQLIGEAVQADVTITMTAPKPANVLPPAADYNGKLIVADIGSPIEIIQKAKTELFVTEAADARRWLVQTRYTPDSYKNTHGHVLVIAGARGFTGAAALCANAAMRSGAGLVTVATPVSAQALVAAQVMPEVMTAALAETDRGTVSDEAIGFVLKFSEQANVIAIGPGLSSEDERTRNFVRAVVEHRKTPIVIDADGLNSLAPWPADLRGSSEHPIILTPHPGEMMRLLGTDTKSALDDRVLAARNFATTHEAIVVLKGNRSLIAAPNGRVFVNPTGNAGLGTAGAGDTLTGIIAGFLAQAYGTLKRDADAVESVVSALYVSGMAGDIAAEEIGMRTMVASDIREHLGAAIRALDPEGEIPGSAAY